MWFVLVSDAKKFFRKKINTFLRKKYYSWRDVYIKFVNKALTISRAHTSPLSPARPPLPRRTYTEYPDRLVPNWCSIFRRSNSWYKIISNHVQNDLYRPIKRRSIVQLCTMGNKSLLSINFLITHFRTWVHTNIFQLFDLVNTLY